ncbi:hypothetical protein AAFN85_20965 [Mucilaginibacter sp. CAU 1740]|uniref:hypothetical protein n=1 Tax=Mucilaginibacter sp. CAU 1740 TaxID=3140365 RepID=UPI00325B7C99
MKPKPKANRLLWVLIITVAFLIGNKHNTQALTSHKLSTDSVPNSTKQREVLLSQQLFVVKLSKLKSKPDKPQKVNFKAELRDAFMVICYDKNKTITELNWTMCPNGKCPITGTFNYGSAQYKQLDTVIANARLANAQSTKKLKSLTSSAKSKTH